jgi:hypothetical protein
MDYTPEQIEKAMKRYEAQKKAWANYNEKLRQKKKDEGTYRPKGRPRKIKDTNTEISV